MKSTMMGPEEAQAYLAGLNKGALDVEGFGYVAMEGVPVSPLVRVEWPAEVQDFIRVLVQDVGDEVAVDMMCGWTGALAHPGSGEPSYLYLTVNYTVPATREIKLRFNLPEQRELVREILEAGGVFAEGLYISAPPAPQDEPAKTALVLTALVGGTP